MIPTSRPVCNAKHKHTHECKKEEAGKVNHEQKGLTLISPRPNTHTRTHNRSPCTHELNAEYLSDLCLIHCLPLVLEVLKVLLVEAACSLQRMGEAQRERHAIEEVSGQANRPGLRFGC